eukprot:1791016-Rhodomonas_salina.1
MYASNLCRWKADSTFFCNSSVWDLSRRDLICTSDHEYTVSLHSDGFHTPRALHASCGRAKREKSEWECCVPPRVRSFQTQVVSWHPSARSDPPKGHEIVGCLVAEQRVSGDRAHNKESDG